MIELAPQHKIGLVIENPVMPAAGFWGYGQPVYPDLIQVSHFGALVTNPITLRPQSHQAEPQVLESNGGVIFNTPPRNPGVKKIIRHHNKFWRRARLPIIAHLPADDPADLARTAGALAGLDTLAAFELELPHDTIPAEANAFIRAILERSELPLFVKLPLSNLFSLAEAVLFAGADALVIGTAPLGAAYTSDGAYLMGNYYGPGIVAQQIPWLIDLHHLYPEAPLIASGGVHTLADVNAYLQAGASAVQLDTVIFTDPAQVNSLTKYWHTHSFST